MSPPRSVTARSGAECITPKEPKAPAHPLVKLEKPDYVVQPKDTLWNVVDSLIKERGEPINKTTRQSAFDSLKTLNPELFTDARKGGGLIFPGDNVRFPPKEGGWKFGATTVSKQSATPQADAAADMARLKQEALSTEQQARKTLETKLSNSADYASKNELSGTQKATVLDLLKEAATQAPDLLKAPHVQKLAERVGFQQATTVAAAPAQPATPAANAELAVPKATTAATATASSETSALNEYARSRMQAMEKDPNSSLNIKLRRAGIDPVAKPFSDSFPIIASPERLAGLPPERVKAAINEAIEFATDLYVAHGGGPSPFLSTIELVPERADGWKDRVFNDDQLMLKTSGSLGVEVPSGKKGHLTSESIHSQWDGGKQFDDSTIGGMWPLMNPVGPVQTTVRKVVSGAAEALGVDLDGIKKKLVDGIKDSMSSGGKVATEDARAQLKALVNQQIAADVPGSDGKGSMRTAAHQVIDRASPEELTRLVDSWSGQARNKQLQDSVMGEVIHTGVQQSPDVTNVALGLITVQNSKTVNVQADAVIGATSVKRFLNQQAGSQKIRQFSLSAIGINLHDSINVQASVTKLQAPTVRALAGVSLAKAFSI